MAKTNHLLILQITQVSPDFLVFFNLHHQHSVWTAKSTGTAVTVTPSLSTVAWSLPRCPQALETKRQHSASPLPAPALPQSQTRTHQPQRLAHDQQPMAHQRVPRPTSTPQRKESLLRLTLKSDTVFNFYDSWWPSHGTLSIIWQRITDGTVSNRQEVVWPHHAQEESSRHWTENNPEITGPTSRSKWERWQILTQVVILLMITSADQLLYPHHPTSEFTPTLL